MDTAGSSETLALEEASPRNTARKPGPPLWLLAELTYRCPLHCVYCSNPVDYMAHREELSTREWFDVLEQARELGAVQLGLSGGEPMLRDDLEEIVAHARRLGFYSNLITSGIGLTESRAAALKAAGLDHIQLSFQDSTRELNDFIGSARSFEHKLRAAHIIKSQGYPMVMNCVMHRYNLQHVDKVIDLAEELGAEFLELANTQFYGWAWVNRAALMPRPEDLAAAEKAVDRRRAALEGRMKILWVSPDYADAMPKACMNGWGSVFLLVSPDGAALPCHSARILPGFEAPFVQRQKLREIWYDSAAFNRYRGTAWMSETCLSCDQHVRDFGGCRCQAYLLTGVAEATDPVCPKSPDHALVDHELARTRPLQDLEAHPLRFVPNRARAGDAEVEVVYRTDDNSRKLGKA